MKKTVLFSALIGAILTTGAYADGFAETETTTVRERITIDTVRFYEDSYIPTKQPMRAKPCRAASSLNVAQKCGCKKTQPRLAPVRVKTYTEVIDHYQIYEPVITYRPAGTYTTRRYIDGPNPHCGTCVR